MKRILALALTLVLCAALFAGCAKTGGEATATPSAAATASAAPTDAATDEPTAAPADGVSLPLVDEPTELTIWSPWGIVGFASFLTDWNSTLGYQLVEKATGVHINWQVPAYGSENEDFQLLIASLDYPDAMEFFTMYYTKGLQDAVENEIIITVDDVVDQYMPTYAGYIADKATRLKVTTDAGYMAAIYCIDDMPQSPWGGNAIRQDWLDDLGLDTPETYDELHDVLAAFKSGIASCEAPMLLDGVNNGGDNLFYTMASGFGVIGDFFQKDGTVCYGPSMEEYADYLLLMRKWYAEGLIDSDFTTRSLFGDAANYVFADKTGYGWLAFQVGNAEETSGKSTDPDYNMVAIKNPVLNKGDKGHFGIIQENVETGCAFSTQCENVELLARWYNYLYSDEAAMALNYGEEGVTYYIDADGNPCLSAEKMEEFYGQPISTCMQANGPIAHAHLRYFYEGRPSRNADAGLNRTYIDAGAVWAQDAADWLIPSFVSMTSDESTEYTALYSDLNTYVDEQSVKIILGALPESAAADLRGSIASMGVDRCIAIRQAALDRYYARGSK